MRLALTSFLVAVFSVQLAVSIPFDKYWHTESTNGMYNNICILPKRWNFLFILDTSVVQFALTLEHLEVAYYTFGLQKFSESDFINAGYTPLVRRRFEEIFEHEQEHVALLTAALGDQAPQACNYRLCVFLEWGLGRGELMILY